MEEYIIFIGIAFWLVYFSTTYENPWIKLFLKLFSTFVIVVTAYIPLAEVALGDRAGLYELFAFAIMNGFIFFWTLWFIVLFYEVLMFFIEKKKSRVEDTQ
jgi:hypothetical protein